MEYLIVKDSIRNHYLGLADYHASEPHSVGRTYTRNSLHAKRPDAKIHIELLNNRRNEFVLALMFFFGVELSAVTWLSVVYAVRKA